MDEDEPLMAEILAIEETLKSAIQLGWRKTNIFSDSKVAIVSITKAELDDPI